MFQGKITGGRACIPGNPAPELNNLPNSPTATTSTVIAGIFVILAMFQVPFKCFTFNNSFNPHNDCVVGSLLSPF